MFVVIVRFPELRQGKEAEFLEWFDWSNRELAGLKGFVSRRLLKPVSGGTYVAVIEHESLETFEAVQLAPVHDEAGRRVAPLLDGQPTVEQYDLVAE